MECDENPTTTFGSNASFAKTFGYKKMFDDLKYYGRNKVDVNKTDYSLPPYIAFFEDDKRKITHHYDNWGFRSSFTKENEYHNIDLNNSRDLAFGCSKTFGYELEHKSTWPYLMNLTNFGVCGGSIETVARLVKAWIPILKPKNIYVQEPDLSRREICYESAELYFPITTMVLLHYSTHLFPQFNESPEDTDFMKSKSLKAFFKRFPEYNIFDDQQNIKIAEEAKKQIELVCDQYDVCLNYMPVSEQPEIQDTDLARDRKHPGPLWNRKMVKLFHNIERKNNETIS